MDAVHALARLQGREARLALHYASQIAATRPEAVDTLLTILEVRWRQGDDTLGAQGRVLVPRKLIENDPRLARRVLDELYRPMLFEDTARTGWNVLVNGLLGTARLQPALVPEALAMTEKFARAWERGKIALPPSKVEYVSLALDRTWLELARLRVENDPALLERGLTSYSTWQRSISLKLLEQLAQEEPLRRPELQALLGPLRHSWRPDQRALAARGLESLRLFEIDEQLDPRRREALRQLAEIPFGPKSLPDLPID